MNSSVLLYVTFFDVDFLGGMVLLDDDRVMCSRPTIHVARDSLMEMISYLNKYYIKNQLSSSKRVTEENDYTMFGCKEAN